MALILCASALVPVAASAAGAKSGKDSPVVVTARTLVADNKKKTVVYKKDVVVKKGDVTLYADEVIIRLKGGSGSKDGDVFKGGGKVDTIEAEGGVKVVQQDKTATAQKAVYHTNGEKIVLLGQPRVWQGDNVINGSRITYDLKEDTFLVEDAKTVLYEDEGIPGVESGDGAGEAGK